MSNDFKFRMEDKQIEVLDNADSWGPVSAFMIEHPQDVGCGRPNYLRVTMGYADWLIDALGEEGWVGRLVTEIYKAVPSLIGAKAILCSSCQNIGFVSPMGERVWKAAKFFSTADTSRMLVLDIDAQRVPEEKREEFYSEA